MVMFVLPVLSNVHYSDATADVQGGNSRESEVGISSGNISAQHWHMHGHGPGLAQQAQPQAQATLTVNWHQQYCM